MTELIAAGGCYNSMRYGRDGAGAGARDWVAAHNTAATMHHQEVLILAVSLDGDDMNNATSATFKIQWRNKTDAGSWTDLAATGEIKWSSSSDLTDGATVVAAEDSGGAVVNCLTKATVHEDGVETEGKNGITKTVTQDKFIDLQWAIDLSGADHANADEYEFRITESGGTVIGTMLDVLTVVTAGKIDGTTKDADRTSAVVSVQVTAFLSDEGTPPKPIGEPVAQLVSSGSDGTYSLLEGIVSGSKYFLAFYKNSTASPPVHLSDGTPEVTAVDR